jgi:uncharacterized protein
MDYQAIIDKYYPDDDDLRRLLLKHSRQVADRCLQICGKHPELALDRQFLEEAAMLHDIGVRWCDAPSICCHGDQPYLLHGQIGGEVLRREGWERHARVAERHTGTGLRREEFARQGLSMPDFDMVPEALEEQVVCYADKFYSKSSPERVRTVLETAQSLEKFGHEGVEKFLSWAKKFE